MTKDNDWKEIEACFIRGRDDGKEYGVPTIVVNPDTLRVGIQTLLDTQREDIAREVERLQANADEHVANDCEQLFVGCVECGKSKVLSEVLARLRAPTTLKDKI